MMPPVGILTFMSRINFVLLSMNKFFNQKALTCSFFMHIANTLTRLGRCLGWSESLLYTQINLLTLSRNGLITYNDPFLHLQLEHRWLGGWWRIFACRLWGCLWWPCRSFERGRATPVSRYSWLRLQGRVLVGLHIIRHLLQSYYKHINHRFR